MLRYCYNFRQSEHQYVNLLGNGGIAWISFGIQVSNQNHQKEAPPRRGYRIL